MNEIGKTQDTRPEFIAILSELKDQLGMLRENSDSLRYGLSALKAFAHSNLKEPGSEQLKKEPSGVVEELWLCLTVFAEINKTLYDSREHLLKLIG